MIKVILIDDEPLARSVVAEYLQQHPSLEIIQQCGDGFEGIKAIQQYQPDLVFLDIQMPKINGFEMLELLDNPPSIIFTTAFDEYAIKAFEANAIDYLLKPFSQERFNKAIDKWKEQQSKQLQNTTSLLLESVVQQPSQSNRIVVKTGNKIKIIQVPDVLFFEAADEYVKINTAEGYFLKKKTMQFFEQSLPADLFVRCHRSYILNISEVTRIEPYEKDNFVAILRSGVQVPVSRNGYIKLKEVMGL
ncbi:MAG TPA: LytTR family transcriptional regulator DNA-binding domain-containing protein [Ferruginibacter sp.]|nr:LytTR family transcriptional regulator DNA-binding domain-containing protein [Ferruginibacter sp.]HRE64804.1 LytTR family transcriptional regulator DNA-binding domain-containing protein [Ferruginibacter sp.]